MTDLEEGLANFWAVIRARRNGEEVPEATEEQRQRWAEARDEAMRLRGERDLVARARDEAELVAKKQQAALQLLEQCMAGFPPSAKAALARGLEDTPAVIAARDWVTGEKRLLLLRGGVGVGKTLAAAMAARHAVLAGMASSVSWHSPANFASGVLHAYAPDAPEVGRDLVVIDDVGREMRTDFGEALCSLIDEKSARVLMTTNLARDQFRERYDPRLIDRLGEIGASVTVKGESRRKNTGGF